MDHIAEKGFLGSFHCSLVKQPISIHEAMGIPEAKAAVNKEWDKINEHPA